MKKVLRIVMASVLIAVTAFAFTACGGAKTDNAAYEIVHTHYLGRVLVTVDKDKTITDVEIDECEMPYTWAQVVDGKIGGVEIAAADTVSINTTTRPTTAKPNGDPTTVTYAKKVKIGNLIFQIDGGDVPYPYAGDGYYVAESKMPLHNIAASSGAQIWDAMAKGEYYVLKADGTSYDIAYTAEADDTHAALKKGDRWFKSKNGYWTVAAPALGWKGNMDKIKAVYVGKKIIAIDSVTKANTDTDKTWSINGASTGATLTDFSDYVGLIYASYTKATI